MLAPRRTTAKTRTATTLLVMFLTAIMLALAIMVASASADAKAVALIVVSPIVLLCLVFIYYYWLGRAWSLAGASVLGAVGVALRLVISTQPSLEVGGGLPLHVTIAYVALGVSVSIASSLPYFELRKMRPT